MFLPLFKSIFCALIKHLALAFMSDSHSLFRQTPLRSPFTPNPQRNPYSQQTPMRTHQPHLHSSDMYGDESEHIYGTTIKIRKAMASIEKFVLDFELTTSVDGEMVTQKIYRSQLNDLELMEKQIFEVDGRHIKEFDKELYLQFNFFPAEMVCCFDDVIRALYEKYFIEPETDHYTRTIKKNKQSELMMEIKHLDEEEQLCMKDLRPNFIGRLVFLRGIVIRSSDIYPEMKSAFFKCVVCAHTLTLPLENAKVKEPSLCDVCRSKDSFEIQHNFSRFTDKQYVKFQELPELVMEGETPASITVIGYDHNVDGFRPGDRVQLIGIYRAYPGKIDREKNKMRSVFNTYIDLISYNILEEKKFRIDGHKVSFTDEQKRQFARMASKETIVRDLANSFAPSIFGHQDIKKGILCQLFGGTKKNRQNQFKGRFRSDINVCLLGDPSTAKSQLLQQVYKIAPRSIFTNGRGSSAVGLTANVRKDPQTHQFVLESGALVLSDQGICCIDEFDKMDQNSRTVLLEAMEQQTISIAKAGIVCQLNSRTAILAAANPIHSKYDSKKSVVQNINLPPSLLSRFDLIFLMLDIQNEHSDKLLATHILDFYSDKPSMKKQGQFSLIQLAKYITYAREYIEPIMTKQAGEKLVKQYLSMRRLGVSRKTISATPRQLQSMIRLSEAFAKMRLSREVTVQDVQSSVSLMMAATMTAATDPATGLIDFDIITTGRSSGIRQKIDEAAEFVKLMLQANQSKYRKATFLDQFIEQFNRHNGKMQLTRDEFIEVFKLLQTNDLLAMFGPNKSNPQFKLQHSVEM